MLFTVFESDKMPVLATAWLSNTTNFTHILTVLVDRIQLAIFSPCHWRCRYLPRPIRMKACRLRPAIQKTAFIMKSTVKIPIYSEAAMVSISPVR